MTAKADQFPSLSALLREGLGDALSPKGDTFLDLKLPRQTTSLRASIWPENAFLSPAFPRASERKPPVHWYRAVPRSSARFVARRKRET